MLLCFAALGHILTYFVIFHTFLDIVQYCSSSSQEEEGNEEYSVQEEVQALVPMLVNPADSRGMLCQALPSPMSVFHL